MNVCKWGGSRRSAFHRPAFNSRHSAIGPQTDLKIFYRKPSLSLLALMTVTSTSKSGLTKVVQILTKFGAIFLPFTGESSFSQKLAIFVQCRNQSSVDAVNLGFTTYDP